MNIGSLYRVKEYYWILFSSKESTDDVALTSPVRQQFDARHAGATAVYLINRFNKNVTYFSPESYIVLLEEDGKFRRVLTADGAVGWIWFIEDYNDCFEEVNQP